MDISRNHWISWGAALVATILLTGAAFAWLGDTADDGTTSSPTGAEGREPELPQAAWSIRTFPAGTAGPPTRSHKRTVERERQGLVRTVTNVVDALIYTPENISALAGKELSPSAAKALRTSKLPLPDRITEVQAIRKKASIGLDPKGANRAAARITTMIKGAVDGAVVKLAGDIRLFLHKRKGRWQVMAFDATREPKKHAAQKGPERSGERQGKKRNRSGSRDGNS